MRRSIVVTSSLLAVAALAAGLATSADPRKKPKATKFDRKTGVTRIIGPAVITQPGRYELARNIVIDDAGGAGVVFDIQTTGVHIDMKGFAVRILQGSYVHFQALFGPGGNDMLHVESGIVIGGETGVEVTGGSCRLDHMRFVAQTEDAVHMTDGRGLVITDTTIRRAGRHGVHRESSGGGGCCGYTELISTQIIDPGVDGAHLGFPVAAELTMQDSCVRGSGGNGVTFDTGGGNLVLDSTRIVDITGNGVFFRTPAVGGLSCTDSHFRDVGGSAVLVEQAALQGAAIEYAQITLARVTIEGVGTDGIGLEGAVNAAIGDSSIRRVVGAGISGIFSTRPGSGFRCLDTNICGIGGSGIELIGPGPTNIRGNQITRTGMTSTQAAAIAVQGPQSGGPVGSVRIDGNSLDRDGEGSAVGVRLGAGIGATHVQENSIGGYVTGIYSEVPGCGIVGNLLSGSTGNGMVIRSLGNHIVGNIVTRGSADGIDLSNVSALFNHLEGNNVSGNGGMGLVGGAASNSFRVNVFKANGGGATDGGGADAGGNVQ